MDKHNEKSPLTINIKQNIFKIIDARVVRKNVFVKEFGSKDEFDIIDTAAFHIVVYKDCKPVATARAFCYDDDMYAIERLCVLQEYRGSGIAAILLSELEQFISTIYSGTLKLIADLESYEYFEKYGYIRSGYPYVTERGVMVCLEKII